ncbi:hypothetical protein CTAYLR_009268 [Chrysophaeum taylorii]|uniref:DUF924 domain-containing protein n=1 Tax=Chrysophaeum taylorii TaxID=2483200 RepID=A0AAD7UJ47_9STRA|nr:hypothetical protein CTAYLR_009268 [Chrysophaeum taylorii]
MALQLPADKTALSVLRRWFGACYDDGFAAASLVASDKLWWGIRHPPGGGPPTPVPQDEKRRTDKALADEFGGVIAQAKKGELDAWRDDGSRGTLAWIILCDQMSRNAYRGTAEAFAMDDRTPDWTLGLMQKWGDLHPIEKMFALLPLEHSENPRHHDACLRAFDQLCHDTRDAPPYIRGRVALGAKHAKDHADVVRQWGRYPHRNAILGRQSTPQELAFLETATSWGQ